VTQKSAHTAKAGDAVLNVESVPFSELPGQSRLFLDYQNDPLCLLRFYPGAVATHADVRRRVPEVLENYKSDRQALCDVLLEQNRRFSASEAAIANIERLRQSDCVAVMTGQQAGLFTGPLYTIYKAFSAVKMAECLRGSGVNAIPVFWVASEDHDFDEVSTAGIINSKGELRYVEDRPPSSDLDLPVGSIELDGSIDTAIKNITSQLPATAFTSEVTTLLSGCWKSGRTFSDAFAATIARLFADHGLVVIDPLDHRLKKLASPVYSLAIERSVEINEALRRRGEALEAAGYHAQVKIDNSYFPLFWHDENGRRISLKFTTRGTVVTKDKAREFTLDELKALADEGPDRFSPGVVLRPVVQDWILPSVCYFGGSAEIAYFAQNSEVYGVLERPVTTILHRQSFTVVEPKARRVMDPLDLGLRDLFDGRDALKLRVARNHLSRDSARVFAEAEERINMELNRLDQHIAPSDPTVAANLATRRRKVLYHIAAIREKFYRSQLRKDKTLDRRIDSLFTHLLPKDQLQERTLNITYFIDQFGPDFMNWIYDSIDLDDRGHRILYL
jgi:bacillithiol biosynthesis cysteine-adding enzyme BshC